MAEGLTPTPEIQRVENSANCISDPEERTMCARNRVFSQTLSKLNMHGCSHGSDIGLLSCKMTVCLVVLGPSGTRKQEQKEARGIPLDNRAKEEFTIHHLE